MYYFIVLSSILKPDENFLSEIALRWHDITGLFGWLILGSGIIEWIPQIKFNPWTWIFNELGKKLNKEVFSEINNIKSGLDRISDKVDNLEVQDDKIKHYMKKRDALNARRRILVFADNLRRSEYRCSEEYFDDIMTDINLYNRYCLDHPDFTNERAVIAQKIISEQYETCIKENNFL